MASPKLLVGGKDVSLNVRILWSSVAGINIFNNRILSDCLL